MHFFILSFFISCYSQASMPEYFGSSAVSSATGNIASANTLASNNFYAASLLSYDKKISYSFNTFTIDPNFRNISGIVTKNPMTTDDASTKTGSVNTNYATTTMFGGHVSIPLFKQGPGLGISFFTPIDKLAEASTGDPYQPEYVMYRSRYTRPLLMFNLFHQLNDEFAVSGGVYNGFQTAAESSFLTRTAGDPDPSSGKIKFNAKPTYAALASVSKKHSKGISYLSYQQEMKSKFTAKTEGITISGGSIPFDFTMNSLQYFDPMILRLGNSFESKKHVFLTALEFQRWDQYRSPKLHIEQNGGIIISSDDRENLKTRNIFVPKIGYEYLMHEQTTLRAGYFYRPSPIDKSSFTGAGNSLDTDVHALTTGMGQKIKIFNELMELSIAYQFHYLKEVHVWKTPGLENGSAGRKIGAGGYRIGGNIQSLIFGISWAI
jgi:hypothetical protein